MLFGQTSGKSLKPVNSILINQAPISMMIDVEETVLEELLVLSRHVDSLSKIEGRMKRVNTVVDSVLNSLIDEKVDGGMDVEFRVWHLELLFEIIS